MIPDWLEVDYLPPNIKKAAWKFTIENRDFINTENVEQLKQELQRELEKGYEVYENLYWYSFRNSHCYTAEGKYAGQEYELVLEA